MAQFRKMVLTNKGRELISKVIAGKSGFRFTRVVLSSQSYTDTRIMHLADLDNIKQTLGNPVVTRQSSTAVEIRAVANNIAIRESYELKSIGLYAFDPEQGKDILYGVAGADVAGYVPAYNGVTVSGIYITFITSVSNADSITMEVSDGTVATIGHINDLQDKITALQSFVGYAESDAYGVEVDFVNKTFTRLGGATNKIPGTDFNTVNAFGGRRRCIVTDDGTVLAYYGEEGYVETGKLEQSVGGYPKGTPVQVMVEQPLFYYLVAPVSLEKTEDGNGYHLRRARYFVSDYIKSGYKVHPAFISNGVVKDRIYLSAYEASLYDVSEETHILDDAQVANFATDMLSSIAGAKPISGVDQQLTRTNARELAHNRGTGWEQAYCATVSATQLLMLIEYATLNMQTAVGSGAVNMKNVASGVNASEPTGVTATLGNATGSALNAKGVQFISYRGEENIWGNIFYWVDGMSVNVLSDGTPKLYVADHDFADNKIDDHYTDTGIILAEERGYISAFGYNAAFDWIFAPTEVTGNSVAPVGDQFTHASNVAWGTVTAPQLGGLWNSGTSAGPFLWNVLNPAAAKSRGTGCRLVYIPA